MNKASDAEAEQVPMEEQSAAVQKAVERGAPQDKHVSVESRAQHLKPYLGLWGASAKGLLDAFDQVAPLLESQYEYRIGIPLMREIAADAIQAMAPFLEK